MIKSIRIAPAVLITKAVEIASAGLGLYFVKNGADLKIVFLSVSLIIASMIFIEDDINEYLYTHVKYRNDSMPFDSSAEQLKQLLFKEVKSRNISEKIYDQLKAVYSGFPESEWGSPSEQNIKNGEYICVLLCDNICGTAKCRYINGQWEIGNKDIPNISEYRIIAFDKKTFTHISA